MKKSQYQVEVYLRYPVPWSYKKSGSITLLQRPDARGLKPFDPEVLCLQSYPDQCTIGFRG